MRNKDCIFFLLFLVFSSSVCFAQFPIFKDGDRVCFIGNSITMNGRFHNYIELYYATRFPDRKIKFFNCGISGDVSGGILARMESDILIHKPNWTILMVGMNDVGRSQYSKERAFEPGIREKQKASLDRYFKNVDSIVRILVSSGCSVVLQTPSIYDQTAKLQTPAHVGVNDALGKCRIFLLTLAKKYRLPVVDYWKRMNTVNARIQQNDPSATIVGQDRVHPDVQGHFVMAYEFLKTQGVPANVSVVSINARKLKVVKQERCIAMEIRNDDSGFSFSSLESALPYPLLASDFNPDSLVSFSSDLNKEILQVSSLKKRNYRLQIDAGVIGEFTAQELKRGINLSDIRTTAQYIQSEKVLNLFYAYWGYIKKIRQVKYVEYQLMDEEMRKTRLTKENGKELVARRMEAFKDEEKTYLDFYQRNFNEYLINKPLESELKIKATETFEEIYRANIPVKHTYRLTAVKD